MLFVLFWTPTYASFRGHGGAVVKHLPPTSEVSGSNPETYVGKLVVAYRWSAVYSTEPWSTVCSGSLSPQNYPSWYDIYRLWPKFCTVNCRPMASNYQPSQLRPCREPNPGLRGGRWECYHSATVTLKFDLNFETMLIVYWNRKKTTIELI